MKYRPEIDGLRALAVLSVILFHAEFELFNGGFIGVDVFFVISGYLITTILIDDIENKRFSIFNFYERRARRILPALFFVMLLCIPFAWSWMLPDPFENFGQSIVATTLSGNNILLFLTSGYWDLAAKFKPLLHTWSIGIEGQYYVFFPLFLVLTWRFGQSLVYWLIISITFISFALSEWLSREAPQAAFYLIHARAWELFSGSISAFIMYNTRLQKSGSLALTGLTVIFISIFAYDENIRWPSIYTLPPVIGVMLVILFAGKETFTTKILSARALVAIGLISYSAYLWHQPILSLAKIYKQTEPSLLLNFTLVVLTFVPSYFSWRYIEKPFRNKSIISRKILLATILTSAVVLVGFGYIAHKSHGLASRVFDKNISYSDIYYGYNDRNFVFKKNEFETNLQLKVLVVGDSFGRDFVNILRETYDISKLELIYRDDYDVCTLFQTEGGEKLSSKANLIIFASHYILDNPSCINQAIEYSHNGNSEIFFIGTKHFGFNQNWITRIDTADRQLLRNPIMLDQIKYEKRAFELIPSANYISIMKPLSNKEGVLITNELGQIISPDRSHLTKYGAIYIGREIILSSSLGKVLEFTQNP